MFALSRAASSPSRKTFASAATTVEKRVSGDELEEGECDDDDDEGEKKLVEGVKSMEIGG